jgi:hypothetical protein
MGGDGLGAGAGVALEGADEGVPGPGEQHRGAGAVLGLMGQQRVPELVQGSAVRHIELLRRRARIGEGPGRELERLLGAAVGQPGPAGDGATEPGPSTFCTSLARSSGESAS